MDQRFFEHLYKDCPKNYKLQVVLCKGKDIAWFPGNKIASVKSAGYYNMVGISGRCYKSYNISQHDQDYYICWAGIDIDDYTCWEKIQKIVPEATIRQSKSHEGLHLFFRFEKPQPCEKGIKGSIVKESLQPFINRLETLCPKNICKHDGNMFFITKKGITQEVLHYSNLSIPFIKPKILPHMCGSVKGAGEKLNLHLCQNGRDFIKLIIEKGLVPSVEYLGTSISTTYIRAWYNGLKDTKYAFKTKSPMKSNSPHVNGCFRVVDGEFQLFGHADGTIVFSTFLGVKKDG